MTTVTDSPPVQDGLHVRDRCPRAQPRCADEEPPLRPAPDDPSHLTACHFPLGDGTWQ